jgi:hypothetical protein
MPRDAHSNIVTPSSATRIVADWSTQQPQTLCRIHRHIHNPQSIVLPDLYYYATTTGGARIPLFPKPLPSLLHPMSALSVAIGIYKDSYCPNKYRYSLIMTADRENKPSQLYNLMTDGGRIVVFREVKVASGAGPFSNLIHLGILPACLSPYSLISVVTYVQDLQISHSDSFDWAVQVVMHMVANNVASAALEECQLRLHLRNATRQWTNGPQVSAPYEFPSDLLLGSAESTRNQRNVRPMRESTR